MRGVDFNFSITLRTLIGCEKSQKFRSRFFRDKNETRFGLDRDFTTPMATHKNHTLKKLTHTKKNS